MKVTIEAKTADLECLANAGLLQGARILERKDATRRQLSKETERVLRARLDDLSAFKNLTGSYDVPRRGANAELGEWLDKLKETYVKAPDGYRISYLREHAPDLLSYLAKWCASKSTREPFRNAPFWLSAAWAADFMERELRAPSQASIHPDEVAIAKWLSRWTSREALAKLGAKSDAHKIACQLDEFAQDLRSRNDTKSAEAKARISKWRSGDLYRMIVQLSKADEEASGVVDLNGSGCIQGEVFWPSWTEWRSSQSAWAEKDGPTVTGNKHPSTREVSAIDRRRSPRRRKEESSGEPSSWLPICAIEAIARDLEHGRLTVAQIAAQHAIQEDKVGFIQGALKHWLKLVAQPGSQATRSAEAGHVSPIGSLETSRSLWLAETRVFANAKRDAYLQREDLVFLIGCYDRRDRDFHVKDARGLKRLIGVLESLGISASDVHWVSRSSDRDKSSVKLPEWAEGLQLGAFAGCRVRQVGIRAASKAASYEQWLGLMPVTSNGWSSSHAYAQFAVLCVVALDAARATVE